MKAARQIRGAGRWVLAVGLCIGCGVLGQVKGAEPKTAGLAGFMAKLGYARVSLDASDAGVRVAGKVNDRKITFTVDTGCVLTLLDRRRAGKLPRLEPGRLKLQDSVWGTLQDEDLALIERLTFGDAEFYNQPARTGDLTLRPADRRSMASHPALSFSSGLGEGVEGLLGHDFLQRHHAVIVLWDQGLYLRAEPRSEAASQVFDASLRASGFESLPVTNAAKARLLAPLTLGTATLPCIIDTGSFATVVDADAAGRGGIAYTAKDATFMMLKGRRLEADVRQLDNVSLGPWHEERVTVCLNREELARLLSGEKEELGTAPLGLLGTGLMMRSYAIVDYGGPRLYVRTRSLGR